MYELKISAAENVSAGRSTLENAAYFAAGAWGLATSMAITADTGAWALPVTIPTSLLSGYVMGDAIEDQFGIGAAMGDLYGRTFPGLFNW